MSTNPTPSICRIVRYRLSGADAQEINHERADSMLAKCGNVVQAGDEYPMIIVKVWGDGPNAAVNGQVLLDGNHNFWAASVVCGEGERTFSWPNQDRPRPAPQETDKSVADHPSPPSNTSQPLSEAPKQVDSPLQGGIGTQQEPAQDSPGSMQPPPPSGAQS